MIPPRPVYFYKPCGRIDYAAMRNHVTRGTKTRKQLLAIEARAARKAAKAAEKPGQLAQVSPRPRALPLIADDLGKTDADPFAVPPNN